MTRKEQDESSGVCDMETRGYCGNIFIWDFGRLLVAMPGISISETCTVCGIMNKVVRIQYSTCVCAKVEGKGLKDVLTLVFSS